MFILLIITLLPIFTISLIVNPSITPPIVDISAGRARVDNYLLFSGKTSEVGLERRMKEGEGG